MEENKPKSLKDREWIPIHREIMEAALYDFTDTDDALNFIQAVMYYSMEGKLPDDFEIKPSIRPAWRFAVEKLNISNAKYLNSPGPPKGSRNNPDGRKGKN